MSGIFLLLTRKSFPNKSVVEMIRSLLVVSDKCVSSASFFECELLRGNARCYCMSSGNAYLLAVLKADLE